MKCDYALDVVTYDDGLYAVIHNDISGVVAYYDVLNGVIYAVELKMSMYMLLM